MSTADSGGQRFELDLSGRDIRPYWVDAGTRTRLADLYPVSFEDAWLVAYRITRQLGEASLEGAFRLALRLESDVRRLENEDEAAPGSLVYGREEVLDCMRQDWRRALSKLTTIRASAEDVSLLQALFSLDMAMRGRARFEFRREAFGPEGASAVTDVPHTVVRHSPTGLEWGYAGSGPADLALNVLNAVVPPCSDDLAPVRCQHGWASDTAMRLHQDFKCDIVSGIPRNGGVLAMAEVRAWLDRAAQGNRPRASAMAPR